ncbi:MAG: glycosyl transferase, family 2 [Candidatus Saccharibacteria bacterium]|nr:glycosyl transferase, family 2 [Candidatus Saccharibacteria bacterium]
MPETSKNKPQVAVITRTKDRPLLLERALKSVLGQTYDDYIMVIINDGGDPNVVEELVAKQKVTKRVKVLHNDSSIGMQAAANKAIMSIDSRYVVVHDDDDTWHPDFLKETTERMEQTGAMGVVASTDLITEKIEGKTVKLLEKVRLFPDVRFISLYRMCYENYAAPISFIFNRGVFKTIGYYDETLDGFGDWDFALRFLLIHDIDFLYSKNALAFYHQRPQSDGVNQNSVFANNQQRLENRMFNRYLRNDIAEGKLGLGYIINSLRNSPSEMPAALQSLSLRINEQSEITSKIINDSTNRLESSMDQQFKQQRSLLNLAVQKLHRKLRRKKND